MQSIVLSEIDNIFSFNTGVYSMQTTCSQTFHSPNYRKLQVYIMSFKRLLTTAIVHMGMLYVCTHTHTRTHIHTHIYKYTKHAEKKTS